MVKCIIKLGVVCMSEKLFRAMSNEVKQWYCIESLDGEMFSIQEVVDLLNELIDENEQLKQEVFVYKKAFQQQVQRCTL